MQRRLRVLLLPSGTRHSKSMPSRLVHDLSSSPSSSSQVEEMDLVAVVPVEEDADEVAEEDEGEHQHRHEVVGERRDATT